MASISSYRITPQRKKEEGPRYYTNIQATKDMATNIREQAISLQ
jgi:hypothetical protein